MLHAGCNSPGMGYDHALSCHYLSCFRYILSFGLISIDDAPRICFFLLMWFVFSPFLMNIGLLARVV
jgi:hypothetical protein